MELPKLKKINDQCWEIPTTYKKGMLVPARIYASKELLKELDDTVYEQLTNVATLPGIVNYAYCMPDAHSGYGFPIGGVAAFDTEKGIISPGGIGFDINCGMRLIATNLKKKDVQPIIKKIVDELFKQVPAGVGCKGFVKLTDEEFNKVMTNGAEWCIDEGYGWKEDLNAIEDFGKINWADPKYVSQRARARGRDQLGTLGSGNHYLEIQYAAKIYDKKIAKQFGIEEDTVCIMVHCGSRGFGHQIGTDYLKTFLEIMPKYNIAVIDKELACAPFKSPEGQQYYKAMACAANMAFANRQVITHRIRNTFSKIFNKTPEELGMKLVYDVAHNIAKIETHKVNGKEKELIVHRKGSTRCFGPQRPELAPEYKKTGQPVILGGSMETGSYMLIGTEQSEETWGSTAHGSGRTMSRTQARKQYQGKELQQKMQQEGIYVKTTSYSGLAEEAGGAYKDVNEVVEVMDKAEISKKVVWLRPLGNVKG